jgi:hypothetical protein
VVSGIPLPGLLHTRRSDSHEQRHFVDDPADPSDHRSSFLDHQAGSKVKHI